MKRILSLFVMALMLCACSSNKSKVSEYLKNTHPEYQIVDDKMTEGTGFMPINQLHATCDELSAAEKRLINTIPLDKEAATKMAMEYKDKYGDVSVLIKPVGANDSKTITVKCVAENEDDSTYVVFFLDKNEDKVVCCSLDFSDYEDDIMAGQRKVMDLVNYVLGDNNVEAKPEMEVMPEPEPEEQNEELNKE